MTDNDLLKVVFSCIDNTTLEGCDTQQKIEQLCNDSRSLCDPSRGIGTVASVCVYPVFIRQAKGLLAGSGIKVACVAGAFPAGQSPIEVKLAEVRYAVDEGADEVDMVISRGALIEGKEQQVYDEIAAIREATQGRTLKVILETGELSTSELIMKASQIAIKAGADFIKTSTGKIKVGATPEAASIMLSAIEQNYKETGRMVGLKIAGGVSTPEQALDYAKMAYSLFGDHYFNNQYFRIGASRLVSSLYSFLTF